MRKRRAALRQADTPSRPAQRPQGFAANQLDIDTDPANYAEIKRITSLPIAAALSDEELEEFNETNVLPRARHEENFGLFPAQAMAVRAYDMHSGVFAPISVGGGKTLTTLMIAQRAHDKGLYRTMLIVPPTVYAQLTKRDIPWARKRVKLTVPFLMLGNKTPQQRKAIYLSGRPGCYIVPYSLLSTKDTSEMLDAIQPKLLILDEAHNVKNISSARTRRMRSYMAEHNPELVALSGTITNKSVQDYHHLITAALGENSPLPLSPVLAGEWGQVIDATAQPDSAATGPVRPLMRWAEKHFPNEEFPRNQAGFRRAYMRRLSSAPGVVSTVGENTLDCTLILQNQPVAHPEKYEGWKQLEALMEQVDEGWKTPNDDEIEHAIHKHKWMQELSAGFYNQLRWPTMAELSKKRGISTEEAYTLIDRAMTQHEAHQRYAKSLRYWLQDRHRPGLDTPFLVGSDMRLHGAQNVGQRLYKEWKEAKDLEFDGMPERVSEAIRVCPFKVLTAVEWAKQLKGKGGIIWYLNIEVGLWLTQELQQAGLNPLHCPAGRKANETIIDPRHRDRVVVASIDAHGTGKNLQHFQEQLVVQWPRPAKTAEQMLGRLHRNGQEADELICHTMLTTEFEDMNFYACLTDALYQHQTLGVQQKVVYCNYDPLPVVFPVDVLIERGFLRGQGQISQEK